MPPVGRSSTMRNAHARVWFALTKQSASTPPTKASADAGQVIVILILISNGRRRNEDFVYWEVISQIVVPGIYSYVNPIAGGLFGSFKKAGGP